MKPDETSGVQRFPLKHNCYFFFLLEALPPDFFGHLFAWLLKVLGGFRMFLDVLKVSCMSYNELFVGFTKDYLP